MDPPFKKAGGMVDSVNTASHKPKTACVHEVYNSLSVCAPGAEGGFFQLFSVSEFTDKLPLLKFTLIYLIICKLLMDSVIW